MINKDLQCLREKSTIFLIWCKSQFWKLYIKRTSLDHHSPLAHWEKYATSDLSWFPVKNLLFSNEHITQIKVRHWCNWQFWENNVHTNLRKKCPIARRSNLKSTFNDCRGTLPNLHGPMASNKGAVWMEKRFGYQTFCKGCTCWSILCKFFYETR